MLTNFGRATFLQQRSLLRSSRVAFSSTSGDLQTLYKEMLTSAGEIKDHNFRDYFIRKTQHMQTQSQKDEKFISADELKKQKDQLERIKTVQNMYFNQENVMQ